MCLKSAVAGFAADFAADVARIHFTANLLQIGTSPIVVNRENLQHIRNINATCVDEIF